MITSHPIRQQPNRLIAFSHVIAAIEQEWSTPLDREIDDYVRHALAYGILHRRDFAEKSYPEFAKTFANVEELGGGCSSADEAKRNPAPPSPPRPGFR